MKLLIVILLSTLFAQGQYIDRVHEYIPAPGQLINTTPWGVPSSASTITGSLEGKLTLGSFGGSVIFSFDQPVENDPNNPFGIDFTIFGNALPDWCEPGVVWVMQDENQNGLPDDTWYEIAGSDHFFQQSVRNYSVTYKNPGAAGMPIPWIDNLDSSGFVMANSFQTQPYYPSTDSFPNINPTEQTYYGTFIPTELNLTGFIKSYAKAFGYADNQLKGSAPWTLPDNPYTPEIENSGGDAIDISWAIDSTGHYVELNQIHFIKIVSGGLENAGILGEISTEITGAVDVAPQPDLAGDYQLLYQKKAPDTVSNGTFQPEAIYFEFGRRIPDAMITWQTSHPDVVIDEDGFLVSEYNRRITLIAALASNPSISDTLTVYIDSNNPLLEINNNPTCFFHDQWNRIECDFTPEEIALYTLSGRQIMLNKQNPLNLSMLPPSPYLAAIRNHDQIIMLKFIKQ